MPRGNPEGVEQLQELPKRLKPGPSRRSFYYLLIGMIVVAACLLATVILQGSDLVQRAGGPIKVSLIAGRRATLPPRVPVPPASSLSASPSGGQAEIQRLIGLGKPLFCGGTKKPYVALTFDDGPGPYTMKTLSILRSYNAGSSFFLVGRLAAEPYYSRVVRAEASYATIGDHTWDHVPVTNEPSSFLSSQVLRTRRLLVRQTGQGVAFFRPPDGYFNSYTDRWLSTHGMIQTLWSVDSRDADGASKTQILTNISKEVKPGSIIELHENRGTTLADLPAILQLLQAKGLTPVSLQQLLTLDPPSLAQVRNGTC